MNEENILRTTGIARTNALPGQYFDVLVPGFTEPITGIAAEKLLAGHHIEKEFDTTRWRRRRVSG